MANTPHTDWSPADHPYAIAVSEAQWQLRTVQLAILRLRDEEDRRISWFGSHQIDARQLIFALRQLLDAEKHEQLALEDLGIDLAVGVALTKARQWFEDALPGIKDMRDALTHFREWSRGQGRGPQKKRRDAGEAPRDVARMYWNFEYDPTGGTVSLGPYYIEVEDAGRAAGELCRAIYLAAHEVDKRDVAALRARTIGALVNAGIRCDTPDATIKVSPGNDLRIWLSLNIELAAENERQDLATRIVASLTVAGFRLMSSVESQSASAVTRLARGEILYVDPEPTSGVSGPDGAR